MSCVIIALDYYIHVSIFILTLGHLTLLCLLSCHLQRMTGYVNTGVNPTSLLTLASLADLGYQVDYSKAEPYNGYDMNNLAPGCCQPPGWENYVSSLLVEILQPPV